MCFFDSSSNNNNNNHYHNNKNNNNNHNHNHNHNNHNNNNNNNIDGSTNSGNHYIDVVCWILLHWLYSCTCPGFLLSWVSSPPVALLS